MPKKPKPAKAKFKPGDKVKVAGKPGTWIIAHILCPPIPAIVNFDWVMVAEIYIYKFIPDKDNPKKNFYAYETDVSEAKK